MTGPFFADTNVLVYADDRAELEKRTIARDLIRQDLRGGHGKVSTQVLLEFFAVAIRRLGLAAADARRRVEIYSKLEVFRPRVDDPREDTSSHSPSRSRPPPRGLRGLAGARRGEARTDRRRCRCSSRPGARPARASRPARRAVRRRRRAGGDRGGRRSSAPSEPPVETHAGPSFHSFSTSIRNAVHSRVSSQRRRATRSGAPPSGRPARPATPAARWRARRRRAAPTPRLRTPRGRRS